MVRILFFFTYRFDLFLLTVEKKKIVIVTVILFLFHKGQTEFRMFCISLNLSSKICPRHFCLLKLLCKFFYTPFYVVI